jgi:hypothetical protein
MIHQPQDTTSTNNNNNPRDVDNNDGREDANKTNPNKKKRPSDHDDSYQHHQQQQQQQTKKRKQLTLPITSSTATTTTAATTAATDDDNDDDDGDPTFPTFGPMNFPNKLYRIVQYTSSTSTTAQAQSNNHSNTDYSQILSWYPSSSTTTSTASDDNDGKFVIWDKEMFMIYISNRYFPNQSSFRSFERVLNMWDFQRDKGVEHELSIRGMKKTTTDHRHPTQDTSTTTSTTTTTITDQLIELNEKLKIRVYRHPLFQRNRPDLCRQISRRHKGVKTTTTTTTNNSNNNNNNVGDDKDNNSNNKKKKKRRTVGTISLNSLGSILLPKPQPSHPQDQHGPDAVRRRQEGKEDDDDERDGQGKTIPPSFFRSMPVPVDRLAVQAEQQHEQNPTQQGRRPAGSQIIGNFNRLGYPQQQTCPLSPMDDTILGDYPCIPPPPPPPPPPQQQQQQRYNYQLPLQDANHHQQHPSQQQHPSPLQQQLQQQDPLETRDPRVSSSNTSGTTIAQALPRSLLLLPPPEQHNITMNQEGMHGQQVDEFRFLQTTQSHDDEGRMTTTTTNPIGGGQQPQKEGTNNYNSRMMTGMFQSPHTSQQQQQKQQHQVEQALPLLPAAAAATATTMSMNSSEYGSNNPFDGPQFGSLFDYGPSLSERPPRSQPHQYHHHQLLLSSSSVPGQFDDPEDDDDDDDDDENFDFNDGQDMDRLLDDNHAGGRNRDDDAEKLMWEAGTEEHQSNDDDDDDDDDGLYLYI